MPGTIQVTVLEFKGVSSLSKPSAKSLKVSMGKRQFQTWEKGDFSFPITKLGEDLVVALLDAGGNEIAHQDIRTMQIMEKGYWDDVFSINGGGHVHMKLQFVLNEEERHRVRLMRESAVKKKLETNPDMKLRLPEVSGTVETSTNYELKISDSHKRSLEIDEVSPKVEASQAGSSLAPVTSSAVLSSGLHEERGSFLENAIPDATDGSQSVPSSPGKHEIKESPQIEIQPLANVRSDTEEGWTSSNLSEPPTLNKDGTVTSMLQEGGQTQKPQNQDSEDRTPSNVRKMISAFESGQNQKKVSSVPAQMNRFRKEVLSEDQEPKVDKNLTDHKDDFTELASEKPGMVQSDLASSEDPKELSSTAPIPSGGSDLHKSKTPPVDFTRQSTSVTATSSGRVLEEQSRVTQPYELSSKSIESAESSVAEGSGRGRGTSLKSSTMIMASNRKPTTLEYYKEECYSGQSSGMWIFPDNTRRMCFTTAGKQVVRVVGHQQNEAKTNKARKLSSESKAHEMNVMLDEPESGSGSFPDDSSNGLVKQVIKIAVVLGFGVLVLLTRQKETSHDVFYMRKNEEDDNFFHVSECV